MQFRASVSEAVGNKIGASVNFINTMQTDTKLWCINGDYYNSFVKVGIDGVYVCKRNMEIYALSMYNLVAGTSGNTEFDLLRHTASGQAGTSIFSTKPSLNFASGVNSYLAKRFYDNVVLQNPTGCVQPVLVSALLNEGDMITCSMTQTQFPGQSAGIELEVRPR